MHQSLTSPATAGRLPHFTASAALAGWSRGVYVLRTAGSVLFSLCWVFAPPYFLGLPSPVRLAAYGLTAAPLVAWLLVKLRRGERLRRSGLELPLFALAAAYAVSLARSTDPRLSVESIFAVATLLLGYYALLDYLSVPEHRRLAVGTILSIALVFTLFALFTLLDWYAGLHVFWRGDGWLELGGWARPVPPVRLRIGDPLMWPNIFAAFLTFALTLAGGKWLQARGIARLGWSAYLLITGFAVWQTYSRGGWLGAAAGAAVLLAAWASRSDVLHLRHVLRTRLRTALLGALAAAGTLAALAVLTLPGLRGRALSSDTMRTEFWRVAIVTMLRHLPFGSGPETFGQVMLATWRPEYVDELHEHAHNAYLQVGAEMGLAGLLALLWLTGALALQACRAWPRVRQTSDWWLFAAACAGLAGLGVHSLVNSFLNSPAILWLTLVFAALVAVLARPALPRQEQRGRRLAQRATLAAILLAYLGALTTGLWPERARAAQEAALTAAARQDWPAAAAALEQAAALDPRLGIYHQQMGAAYGMLAAETSDPALLELAIAALRRGLAAEPNFATNRANLAALLWQAGRRDEAIAEMARAAALDPRRPHYAIALGRYLEAAGRLDEAIEAYAEGLSRRPELARSSFWRLSEFRRATWERIRQQADAHCLGRPPWARQSCRRSLALAAGDLAAAGAASDPAQAGHLALQRGDVPAALAAFRQAARRAQGPAPYLGLARACLLAGDLECAEHAARMARFVSADTLVFSSLYDPAVHAVLGRVAEARGDLDRAIAEYRRALGRTVVYAGYGRDVWRRPTLLPPELPQVSVLDISAGLPEQQEALHTLIAALRRRGTAADLAEADLLAQELDQLTRSLAQTVPAPARRYR